MSNHNLIRFIRFVSRFTVYLCNAIFYFFSTTFDTPCRGFINLLKFWSLDPNEASIRPSIRLHIRPTKREVSTIKRLEHCGRRWAHRPEEHGRLCLRLSMSTAALSLWTRTFHPGDRNETNGGWDSSEFQGMVASTGVGAEDFNLLQDSGQVVWGSFQRVVLRRLLDVVEPRVYFCLQRQQHRV